MYVRLYHAPRLNSASLPAHPYNDTHTHNPQPAQTRVLHPITPAEEAWRRPDAAALAAEGLEAKFAVINLKTKQYKVTKVRRWEGCFWVIGSMLWMVGGVVGGRRGGGPNRPRADG